MPTDMPEICHLHPTIDAEHDSYTTPHGNENSSHPFPPVNPKTAVDVDVGVNGGEIKKERHIEEGSEFNQGQEEEREKGKGEEEKEPEVRPTPVEITLDVCVDEFRCVHACVRA